MKKIFTCDFETTTNPNDCRVWATGICDVYTLEFKYGNSIDYLFEHFEKNDGALYLFHHLKFDGEFILYELFKRNYRYVAKKNEMEINTFNTLISDMGLFYSIEICYGLTRTGKLKKVKIQDSLKLLNMSVDKVAEAFHLPLKKLHIDYDADRPIGYELTSNEVAYLKNDVTIMAMAMQHVYAMNMKKMTQGSNALNQFKKIVGLKNFKYYFPPPPYDEDVRQAYKGGFTWANPIYQGQQICKGLVLDVNSLYPYVMYDKWLPYGEGKFYEGKYERDKQYPLFIQMLTCSFELKKDHIPTIQIKNSPFFPATEYLRSSKDKYGLEHEVTLCLTSVDLKLFFEHYHVYNIEYHSGWKFMKSNNIFKEYIDYWYAMKEKATKEGNGALRTWAKIMLNALYGKFATSPKCKSKIPIYDENEGMIHYVLSEEEERDPLYVPVAAFITAYARELTIRSAQKCYDRVLYCDTDSMHLIGWDIPADIEVDDFKLGAWKIESKFSRAVFLRAKAYMEKEIKEIEINGKKFTTYKNKVTCSGMQARIHDKVNYSNFSFKTEIDGQLKFKRVKGGVVLEKNSFTIREKNGIISLR